MSQYAFYVARTVRTLPTGEQKFSSKIIEAADFHNAEQLLKADYPGCKFEFPVEVLGWAA